MIATAHAVTGATIAVVVKKPKLAIPLAFLSHFICDSMPHFSLGFKFGAISMYVYLALEALAMFSIALFLYKKKVRNLMFVGVCAFVAMSPDLAWLFYGLKGQQGNVLAMDPLAHFHYIIQWAESRYGLIFDILWIAIMLKVLINTNNEDNQNRETAKEAK